MQLQVATAVQDRTYVHHDTHNQTCRPHARHLCTGCKWYASQHKRGRRTVGANGGHSACEHLAPVGQDSVLAIR